MTPTTGEIGKQILITGSGLYLIDRIIFSGGYNNTGVSASFTAGIFNYYSGISSGIEIFDVSGIDTTGISYTNATFNKIEFVKPTIPPFAAWGTIRIESTQRGVTGYSINPFVPKPVISGFYPNSGVSGDIISVSGYSFSGVNGILINNIPVDSFTVNSHSGLTFTVPSGNTNGQIRISGQSGISTLSKQTFYPIAKITGFSSSAVPTGTTIEILGVNFFPNIMYNLNGNNYLVTFNNATGSFQRVNNNILSGLIPYSAKSGYVNVNKDLTTLYQSNSTINITQNQPVITGVSIPLSGKIGTRHYIKGSNFSNATGILISGSGNIIDITNNSNTTVSWLNDTIFFSSSGNMDEGYNSIIVRISGVGETSINSGLFVMYPPEISGVNPKVASSGDIITISGQYLYPQSKVYFNNDTSIRLSRFATSSDNRTLQVIAPDDGTTMTSGFNTIYVNNTVNTVSTGFFNFIPYIGISGLNRNIGAWGDTVIISGSGIDYATGIYFDTGYVDFSSVGTNQISFEIPDGADANKIIVYGSGRGGSAVYEDLDILYPLPIASGFVNTGVYQGGTIHLTGAYLGTVTGVLFSGDYIPTGGLVGRWISSSGFRADNTGFLLATVPSRAVSGPMLIGNNSGIVVTPSIEIIRNPEITGSFIKSGAYGSTITLSGRFFESGFNQFYFTDISGKLREGLNTTISNKFLATTQVTDKLTSGNFYASGVTGQAYKIGTFIPLPSISGFTPPSILTDDNRYPIRITGINCWDVESGYLYISGSGRMVNLCDQVSDISFNHETTNSLGHTLITGLVQPNFSGSGFLFLKSKHTNNNFVDLLTYVETDKIFTDNKLIINQVKPTISGWTPLTGGGDGTVFTISGNNLNLVTSLYVDWVPSLGNSNNLIISNQSSKEITAIGNDKIEIIQTGTWNMSHTQTGTFTTHPSIFIWTARPYIASTFPELVLTGTYFRISGSGLGSVTGIYLENALSGRVPVIEFYNMIHDSDPFGMLSDSSTSGIIPNISTLADGNWKVIIENPQSGTSFPIKIIDEQNLRKLRDSERNDLVLTNKQTDITTL